MRILAYKDVKRLMSIVEYQLIRGLETFNLKKRRFLVYMSRYEKYVSEDVGLNYGIRMSKFSKKHAKSVESTCCFFSYGSVLKTYAKESLTYTRII